MSFIRYNDVVMGLVQTRAYRQEPIVLGQDIAGTRHTLTARVTIARTTLGPPVAGNNVARTYTDGAQALIALRDQLMAPRKPLRFDVGNRTFASFTAAALAAFPPAAVPAGTAVDMELGPKPLACTILGFNSVGSIEAEYTIQWAERNPCPGRNGVMAVLAHVWKSEDVLNKDFYMTRTYTGEIHFDPRVVGPAGTLHPDAIKRLLVPPLVSGLRRDEVRFVLSEDGYSMRYRLIDTQPVAYINNQLVRRIEASHSIKIINPHERDILQARAEIIEKFGALGAGKDPIDWVGWALNVFGTTFKVTRLWDLVAIPENEHTVTVKAYGPITTPYNELARACRIVVLYRMMKGTAIGSTNPNNIFGGSYESTDISTDTERASQASLVCYTRPGTLEDNGGNATWNAGRNLIPTISDPPGNILGEADIVGAGQPPPPVPDFLRELVYQGSLGATTTAWGWQSGSFANALMSNRAGANFSQGWTTVGEDGTRFPFQAAFLQALQNPCADKTVTAGNTGLRTQPLNILP